MKVLSVVDSVLVSQTIANPTTKLNFRKWVTQLTHFSAVS